MAGRLAQPGPTGWAWTRDTNALTALTPSLGSSTARLPMSYSAYCDSTRTAVAAALPRPLPVLPSTMNSKGHMPPLGASPAPLMPVQQVPTAQLAGRVPAGPQASGGTRALVPLTACSMSERAFTLSQPPVCGLDTTAITRAEMPLSAPTAPDAVAAVGMPE